MTLARDLTATRQVGHPLAHYRGEFPIFRDKIYLNTCSLGALGERTRRRIAEFLDLWQERGASAWYDVWWAALAELRRRRSEEHTSELQSQSNLVCRLLLEKKKKKKKNQFHNLVAR